MIDIRDLYEKVDSLYRAEYLKALAVGELGFPAPILEDIWLDQYVPDGCIDVMFVEQAVIIIGWQQGVINRKERIVTDAIADFKEQPLSV